MGYLIVAAPSSADAVLDGLSRALLLDDSEREYVRRLAEQAGRATRPISASAAGAPTASPGTRLAVP